MRLFVLKRILRGKTNKTMWIFHLIHYLVTDINAGGAGDTFILQAVTNVDTGRTYLDTQRAINAITQAGLFQIRMFSSATPRFTALLIIKIERLMAIRLTIKRNRNPRL